MSFLFPGLGQAYAGSYVRAVLFAVPTLLTVAVAVAVVLLKGVLWLGIWASQTSVLGWIAAVNILILVYRSFCALDAYRITSAPIKLTLKPRRLFGSRPGQLNPASLGGLMLILVVMVAGHVFVGYWDARLYNLKQQLDSPLVLEQDVPGATDSIEPIPSVSFPPQMTFEPAATVQPWNGTGRLNILLVGYDIGGRTDSMIVVSVDPTTHQVALFSVLRDAISMPMPPKSRLSQCVGPYFNQPITNLWNYAARACPKLFPHGGSDALKQALGYTFFGNQSAIQYYVAVGYAGFEKIVDTLGGVNINAPIPVADNDYLPYHGAHDLRVYIPAGIQHMDGAEALIYARVGHHGRYGSSVWARTIRQQQVVVALEQQADFDAISSHLSELLDELGSSVRTDVLNEGPDVLQPLLELARQIKPTDIKSYVWATSHPDYAAIRSVVKSVISSSGKAPSQLQAAIDEQAAILVENGTGISGQETTLASQLQNLGLNAEASADVPSQLGGSIRIQCVDGAESKYPATLAELENILGISGTPSSDPNAAIQIINDPQQATGFVIVTGTNTPDVSITPAP